MIQISSCAVFPLSFFQQEKRKLQLHIEMLFSSDYTPAKIITSPHNSKTLVTVSGMNTPIVVTKNTSKNKDGIVNSAAAASQNNNTSTNHNNSRSAAISRLLRQQQQQTRHVYSTNPNDLVISTPSSYSSSSSQVSCSCCGCSCCVSTATSTASSTPSSYCSCTSCENNTSSTSSSASSYSSTSSCTCSCPDCRRGRHRGYSSSQSNSPGTLTTTTTSSSTPSASRNVRGEWICEECRLAEIKMRNLYDIGGVKSRIDPKNKNNKSQQQQEKLSSPIQDYQNATAVNMNLVPGTPLLRLTRPGEHDEQNQQLLQTPIQQKQQHRHQQHPELGGERRTVLIPPHADHPQQWSSRNKIHIYSSRVLIILNWR